MKRITLILFIITILLGIYCYNGINYFLPYFLSNNTIAVCIDENTFEYEIDGKVYQTYLQETNCKVGDEITLLVDSDNPSEAKIREEFKVGKFILWVIAIVAFIHLVVILFIPLIIAFFSLDFFAIIIPISITLCFIYLYVKNGGIGFTIGEISKMFHYIFGAFL